MAANLYQAFFGFVLVYFSNWFTRRLFPEGALY